MRRDIKMAGLACFFLGILLLCSPWSYASIPAEISINGHVIRVEIPSNVAEQRLGLGGRKYLPEGTGMLFLYRTARERIFWMKRMRFAIDIVWILRDKIVHIEKNVPPPSVMRSRSRLPTYGHGIVADMVLEVPKGFADLANLKRGDAVQFLQ